MLKVIAVAIIVGLLIAFLYSLYSKYREAKWRRDLEELRKGLKYIEQMVEDKPEEFLPTIYKFNQLAKRLGSPQYEMDPEVKEVN